MRRQIAARQLQGFGWWSVGAGRARARRLGRGWRNGDGRGNERRDGRRRGDPDGAEQEVRAVRRVAAHAALCPLAGAARRASFLMERALAWRVRSRRAAFDLRRLVTTPAFRAAARRQRRGKGQRGLQQRQHKGARSEPAAEQGHRSRKAILPESLRRAQVLTGFERAAVASGFQMRRIIPVFLASRPSCARRVTELHVPDPSQ